MYNHFIFLSNLHQILCFVRPHLLEFYSSIVFHTRTFIQKETQFSLTDCSFRISKIKPKIKIFGIKKEILINTEYTFRMLDPSV